ncbi:MAG TPA: DNA recombination protein RmuC [Terracidiphilus sp.]|jgi:DNA recombination protein RmuC|nr:DNA recombination protein RmuC [Terracidiphilus sp.]
MQGFLPVFSALLGIVVGIALDFVYRLITEKKERATADAERTQLSQRISALAAELAAARTEATQTRDLAERRAGFESLSIERERMIGLLNTDREKIVTNLSAERDRALAELRQKNESERRTLAEVSQLRADLLNEKRNLTEKLALLDTAKSTLSDQFQALANEIVEKRSKVFADANKKDLDGMLTPLRDQLTEFRKKVEEAQKDSKVGVDTLQGLIGGLNSMNQQLAEETRSLSTVLRGSSKVQGDWGELIVRNLLEKAGLREGEQFHVKEFREATRSENGRRKQRPDIILDLPGSRHLVIDSGIPLTTWSEWVNAASDEDREQAMNSYLASVRGHIDGIAARSYHRRDGVESPDFVVMFIPIEPAFLAALHEDDAIWRYAYDKEVLLVGPTTLLFVIRIVDNLWQQDLQTRTVQEVIERGAALYEKFVDFAADFEALGDNLHKVDQCYAGAMKKFNEGPGNLVRQVETLRELGVKSSKSLPRPPLDRVGIDEPFALSVEAGEPIGAD